MAFVFCRLEMQMYEKSMSRGMSVRVFPFFVRNVYKYEQNNNIN